MYFCWVSFMYSLSLLSVFYDLCILVFLYFCAVYGQLVTVDIKIRWTEDKLNVNYLWLIAKWILFAEPFLSETSCETLSWCSSIYRLDTSLRAIESLKQHRLSLEGWPGRGGGGGLFLKKTAPNAFFFNSMSIKRFFSII